MSAGRRIGFGFFGAVAGAMLGGGAGLLGGLGWVELARTSSFEGYSGYVVVYWIVGGLLLGFLVGAVAGAKRGG